MAGVGTNDTEVSDSCPSQASCPTPPASPTPPAVPSPLRQGRRLSSYDSTMQRVRTRKGLDSLQIPSCSGTCANGLNVSELLAAAPLSGGQPTRAALLRNSTDGKAPVVTLPHSGAQTGPVREVGCSIGVMRTPGGSDPDGTGAGMLLRSRWGCVRSAVRGDGDASVVPNSPTFRRIKISSNHKMVEAESFCVTVRQARFEPIAPIAPRSRRLTPARSHPS